MTLTFADPAYRAYVAQRARDMYLRHEITPDQYAEATENLAVIEARRRTP